MDKSRDSKAACPSTYFYALVTSYFGGIEHSQQLGGDSRYDDTTSLFTCTSSLEADYTITYC